VGVGSGKFFYIFEISHTHLFLFFLSLSLSRAKKGKAKGTFKTETTHTHTGISAVACFTKVCKKYVEYFRFFILSNLSTRLYKNGIYIGLKMIDGGKKRVSVNEKKNVDTLSISLI
jgi:hypothetical protein